MDGRDEKTGPGRRNGRSPLPPPAFPPGSRRHADARGRPGATPAARDPGASADDPFISPDDPLPGRNDALAGALILPDEPILRSGDAGDVDGGGDAFISPDDPLPSRDRPGPSVAPADDVEEGVVTGMGDDAHLDPTEFTAAGDPHVMRLTDKIVKLGEALKRKGEAGLRTTPEMDRFDATLRGYCVGFLAGRRAEEDDAPGY